MSYDFKNTDNKYRPVPFWSWNEKLNVNETERQVEIMKDAGLGGFFMHARGGLQTEYMGDEWFENIEAGAKKAKGFKMHAWAYDENGWPSGFANNKVNGLGDEYRQKYLRMEKGEKHTEHTITNYAGYHFYYDINPFYVDTLDKKVIKKFIEFTYEPYAEKLKDGIEGFFTDEPQITEGNIPWSLTLPEQYEKEYGENLLLHLHELFTDTDDFKNTRKKFWRLVTKLFSENYFGQIGSWCRAHGMKLTGHLVSENTVMSQITTNGACMPHYEFFDIPGIDCLGRDLLQNAVPLQVASVAAQTGKKQILSESFAMCGHNVSFSELRRIYEHQMVRGVNLLCQHLEGYSLRGIRKRDFPPALFYQQPWWNEYRTFNYYVAKIGKLVSEGKSMPTTLLIHPQTSAWIYFDGKINEKIEKLNADFEKCIETLEAKHISFHLGDETVIERHAKVKNGKFIVGEMSYETLVIPPHEEFLENTERLIEQFKSEGGKVISAEDAKANEVTDNPNITYLFRKFDDFDVHYFVNSTKDAQNAKLYVNGKKLNVENGTLSDFDSNYRFEAFDSAVIIDDRKESRKNIKSEENNYISANGEWEIVSASENAVTLDKCDLYTDGVLQEKNIDVTSIQAILCDKGVPVETECVFKANVNYIPNPLFLVCETPEIFEISVNGKPLKFKDEGFFRDISFRKTDISSYMVKGENTISMKCTFSQSEKTYEDLRKSKLSETERNKLTYDMEIESIYLTGDFSVKCDGEFSPLPNDAVRSKGGFTIEKPKKTVNISHIEQQGFPFFAGEMTLRKQITTENADLFGRIELFGINAVKVKVNDKNVGTFIWKKNEFDLKPYLKDGVNTLEITLFNNLRNLLGPHHLKEGETLRARPSSFFCGVNLWTPFWAKDIPTEWDDNYCFVENSIIFE